MDFFEYRNGESYCEETPLSAIAEQVGTPAYVYSLGTMKRHLTVLKDAFKDYPTTLCYAVKANSNLSLLKEIAANGYGADIVSLGELRRCQIAGFDPLKVVYSGVGKTRQEIEAALDWGIKSFNVESAFELEMISYISENKGKIASVSLRVNPNIDAKTNPKITTGMYSTKFGVVEDVALQLAAQVKTMPSVNLIGIACHIGSQITDLTPLKEAGQRMAQLALKLKEQGHELELINMGGGLGIRYNNENPPTPEQYSEALMNAVRGSQLNLVVEPGRVLMGNTGVLLTEVIGVKTTSSKTFVVVDGAMNDLMRPSMYDSFHQIEPVKEGAHQVVADIVGPICESGDFFGKDRHFSQVSSGDLVFVRGCGAYAASMASNYNSRPRAAEVLVEGSSFKIVRRREELTDLWSEEIL